MDRYLIAILMEEISEGEIAFKSQQGTACKHCKSKLGLHRVTQ